MSAGGQHAQSSWFQRYLLPGFAFKSVVIGGGYATGRELAEFFLPSGPWGGLQGMLFATLIWSLICAATFAFSRATGAFEYRAFFQRLLGRAGFLFELAYILFIVLILSVFGATAGSIGAAMFGLPEIYGAVFLAVAIVIAVMFGNESIERLFKYATILLYTVYVAFLVLSLTHFGDDIQANFSIEVPTDGWATGGLTYASYNAVCAVMILPMLRHLTSQRDAVVAGLLAGPLAMLPAILFYIAMIGFYPAIGDEALPSNFILEKLNIPLFHFVFQGMVLIALLESGAGAVHSINERISTLWQNRGGTELGTVPRAVIGSALLVGCIFVADWFGLIQLIANGYRLLALIFLTLFVGPVLTIGVLKLIRHHQGTTILKDERLAS